MSPKWFPMAYIKYYKLNLAHKDDTDKKRIFSLQDWTQGEWKIYSRQVSNCFKIFLVPFWKGVYSERKEFAPLWSKFFPFRVDPSEGIWCAEKQTVCISCKKWWKNLLSISSPLNAHGYVSLLKQFPQPGCICRWYIISCYCWNSDQLYDTYNQCRHR